MRKVPEGYSAPRPHWVGEGFPVRSLVSHASHDAHVSPFPLLDYARSADFAPAGKPRGVDVHPHRGFETVTIVYEGEVEHRDSTGKGGVIGPGGVQWMTAAGGILHKEYHSQAFTRKGGTLEMVQLRVNLPAFAPDKGESVASLIKNRPSGAPVPPILPPHDGFLFLDKAKFRASFAPDVSEEKAAFMADSQVPWGVCALTGAVTEPACKSKPSWYLVTTEDKMIPPPAQRHMATRAGARVAEPAGSHAIYISKPEAVAALIAKATKSVSSEMAA